ncbi:AsnC family protein [Tistrella sp.]|nr:AsnC family protein [Tistrella sp.]|tara:strand:- start:2449 stop:2586 length:138 start_codon:yes stop_codon:yes gene_type:complete
MAASAEPDLDAVDRRILRALQEDGRITVQCVGKNYLGVAVRIKLE